MRKKNFIMIFIVIAMAITLMVPNYEVKAETELEKINRELLEIERQHEEATQKAKDLKGQISGLKGEQEEIKADINHLTEEIKETEKKLFSLEGQISGVTIKAKDAAVELDKANKRVEKRDAILKTRVRLMYKTGKVDYLEVLLKSTSFSDFLQRFNALQKIVKSDKKILSDNIKDKKIIEDKKLEIDTYLAELEGLYSETEELKSMYVTKQEKQQVKIAALEQSIDDLEDISAEEEKRVMELALEQARKENQKRILEYGGGLFYWPVPESRRITSDFGLRIDPINGKRAGHSGIDIGHAPNKATLYGADIVAAADGVVLISKYVSGYGNCIIINHGSGLWTLYGHIRNGGLMVKAGQKVSMGQKIAEVGSTGRSTGPHLHFEVRLNNTPVNPWDYLK